MSLAPLVCLLACSGDNVPTTPTTYRITFQTTDPNSPTRTISATIDWANNTFVSGMNGTDASTPLIKSYESGTLWAPGGDTWHLPAGTRLDFSFMIKQPADITPTSDELYIDALSIWPTSGGCAGKAAGAYSWAFTDVLNGFDVRPDIDCVVDHEGPVFTSGHHFFGERWPFHPLELHTIGASEYLGPIEAMTLVDAAGTMVALAPSPAGKLAYGISRLDVVAALSFASEYTLQVMPGADVAGNPSSTPLQITTTPDPGFFAQDGFEGPVQAKMSSSLVEVVNAPDWPIPTGNKALDFPMGYRLMPSRFTARLKVPPGATAAKTTYVRYRGKAPDGTAPSPPYPESHIVWTVAVPNSTSVAVYDKDQAPVTVEERPWASEPLPVQAGPAWFSQPQTLTFPLPALGDAGEVLFDVYSDSFTASGDSGFLLDDLRVE
jgi:hypothetical protein